MNLIELILIAIGLSMDAFAVAICLGLFMRIFTFRKALTVGLYFGIFQAGMPLIGYFAATFFAQYINAYAHWIAFIVLGILGVKMIVGSFGKEKKEEASASDEEANLSPLKMLPFAVATSIDAAAVGVTFAALEVNVIFAVAAIGIITLVLSMIGVKIGNVFGVKFKSKAEFAGGVILVLIGIKILLEAIIVL